MAAKGAHLQDPDVKAKAIKSRVKNFIDSLPPEQAEAARRDFLEEMGAGSSDHSVDHAEAHPEAVEILRQQDEEHDYSKLEAMLDRQIEKTEELLVEADDDGTRNSRQRRIESLRHLKRLAQAAMNIKPELHTFGCRKLPQLKISGRNSGFPTIQFRHHTYNTSDPLEIARLLDYMENQLPGDPPIRTLRPGMVALVDSETGVFRTWEEGIEADRAVAESGGAMRRPYR